MPSEIINKLTEAENQSEEREKSAHAEAEAIIKNAELRAEEIIKDAELECENILSSSEIKARDCAESIKTERAGRIKQEIEELRRSAESNSGQVLNEILKALA